MNIKQLETFLTIVQVGNFAATAGRMHATQSTVSARIQELEQELGVSLFDRSGRRAHLTAKGRELVPYARHAVRTFAEIKHRVGAPEALSGVVRMGVAELVAVTWLPKLASTIHERCPNLTLEFTVSLTAELLDGLGCGDLEMALVPGARFETAFASRSLGSVRFSWMASGSFPAPDHAITPQELGQWRILSLGEKSYHSDTMRDWLDVKDSRGPPVDVCNSMSVIASLTAAGLGVSLLPEPCYAAEIASGRLRVLPTKPPGPKVEFSAIHPRRQPALIQELIAELAAEVSTFDRQTGPTNPEPPPRARAR